MPDVGHIKNTIKYLDVFLCSSHVTNTHEGFHQFSSSVYFERQKIIGLWFWKPGKDYPFSWIVGMNVLYSLWAVYLFIGLGVTADAFFVPTLTRISGIFLSSRLTYTEIPVVFLEYWPHYMAHIIWVIWYGQMILSVKWLKYVYLERIWKDNLRLSDNVAGVTLVALGNGAPDIFSAIVRVKSYFSAHLLIKLLTF